MRVVAPSPALPFAALFRVRFVPFAALFAAAFFCFFVDVADDSFPARFLVDCCFLFSSAQAPWRVLLQALDRPSNSGKWNLGQYCTVQIRKGCAG